MNLPWRIIFERRRRMILPDINLLIYAHNVRSPRHERARDWWNRCLQGNQGVALAWVVVMGFVRIATHPKVFASPMPINGALGRVEEWLGLPHIHLAHPSATHFQTWSTLLNRLGTAADLTTDAHLAALAIERSLVLHTTDADFTRFPGLKWKNPLSRVRANPPGARHKPSPPASLPTLHPRSRPEVWDRGMKLRVARANLPTSNRKQLRVF
jgi:toxin-antitoxin system PIN domain toxin